MKKTLKIIGGLLLLSIIAVPLYVYSLFEDSLSYEQLEHYADSTLVLDNGMQVNYRVAGNPQRQTLLLIHGGAFSLGSWELWEGLLADKYRIVSVDLPGHGLTDLTLSAITVPEP